MILAHPGSEATGRERARSARSTWRGGRSSARPLPRVAKEEANRSDRVWEPSLGFCRRKSELVIGPSDLCKVARPRGILSGLRKKFRLSKAQDAHLQMDFDVDRSRMPPRLGLP